MKIAFTSVDVSYACGELGRALVNAISTIVQGVKKYESREDDRTLVVVLTCPCCRHDPLLDLEKAVLVSPFKGIDCCGYAVHCTDKYPPFRNPGREEEAMDLDGYLSSFRATIDRALK